MHLLEIVCRHETTTTTITITTTRSRFVFFCTRSKAECRSHPFRGKFGELSKAHGLTHTLNPALCRAGHYTFVECRRRCIIVCATIEDKNQMGNFINPKLIMTTLTLKNPYEPSEAGMNQGEPRKAQTSPREPRGAQTSPEEHRSVQESPDEPEESPGEPNRAQENPG